MNKPISITLPEKLILEVDKYCDEYMMNRSELIKNALVTFIRKQEPKISDPLTSQEQEEIMREIVGTQEASEKPVSEVPAPQEPTESQTPELPPFCEGSKFCKSRSYGKYRIVTDNGENESTKNLCSIHKGEAQREASVMEEIIKYALH